MTLAHSYNLRPADVIIGPKSIFNVVQHFIVFECIDINGVDWYLENKQGVGVHRIDGATMQRENAIHDIKRFHGNDSQRTSAIRRAQSLMDKPYNLLNFNCEHYATYAQTGNANSKQVDDWFNGAMIGLGIVSLIAIGIGAFGGRGKR